MGLRDKLRRLTRQAERDMVSFTLENGTVKRFYEDEVLECFPHEWARCRRAWNGEEPGPPHPVIEALRHVSEDELHRVIRGQGTMLGHMVTEDERIQNGGGPIKDLSE